MATPPVQEHAVRLDADASFTRLPRPDHDAVRGGVRPRADRVPAVVAAVLLVAAPGGAWVRVSEVVEEGGARVLVGEVLGLDLDLGGLLVAAAASSVVLVLALAGGWHRVAVVAGLAAVVLPSVVLVAAQADMDRLVQDAIARPAAATRTVGLGWGGWAALAGVGSTALAVQLTVMARGMRARPEGPAGGAGEEVRP